MKTLILSTALTLCTSILFAQFEVGVKGAYNTIFIQNQNNYGQKEMDYDEHFGINPGIWMAKDICEKSQLVVELSYLKQGQEYFDQFNNHKFDKRVDLSYITVPILYRKYFMQEGWVGEGTHFFINLGPQLALLQSAEIDWKVNDLETDMFSFVTLGPPANAHESYLQGKGNPEDDADLFNKFDLLGVIGMGIHSVPSEHFVWTLEFRGGLSLLDINHKDYHLENQDNIYEPSRNMYGGIHLGIGFRSGE